VSTLARLVVSCLIVVLAVLCRTAVAAAIAPLAGASPAEGCFEGIVADIGRNWVLLRAAHAADFALLPIGAASFNAADGQRVAPCVQQGWLSEQPATPDSDLPPQGGLPVALEPLIRYDAVAPAASQDVGSREDAPSVSEVAPGVLTLGAAVSVTLALPPLTRSSVQHAAIFEYPEGWAVLPGAVPTVERGDASGRPVAHLLPSHFVGLHGVVLSRDSRGTVLAVCHRGRSALYVVPPQVSCPGQAVRLENHGGQISAHPWI
jgi:hypothetical protein